MYQLLLQALGAMSPVTFQLCYAIPAGWRESASDIIYLSVETTQRTKGEHHALIRSHVWTHINTHQKVEDFDVSPAEYRETMKDNLPSPLHTIQGEQWCTAHKSIILPYFWNQQSPTLHIISSTSNTPQHFQLEGNNSSFQAILDQINSVTNDEVQIIQQRTWEQSYYSSEWCRAICFRLTSSLFWAVLSREKEHTTRQLGHEDHSALWCRIVQELH